MTNDAEDDATSFNPDLGEAFAEANFQLHVLKTLQERARTIERVTLYATVFSVSIPFAIGAAAIATGATGRHVIFLGSSVNAAALILALLGVIATLGAVLFAHHQKARLQQGYIEAETLRLRYALENAQRDLAELREEHSQ